MTEPLDHAAEKRGFKEGDGLLFRSRIQLPRPLRTENCPVLPYGEAAQEITTRTSQYRNFGGPGAAMAGCGAVPFSMKSQNRRTGASWVFGEPNLTSVTAAYAAYRS